MKLEQVSDTIERLIGELPPARQQASRRLLAKLHDENPTDMLLFELTIMRIGEMGAELGRPTPSAPESLAAKDESKAILMMTTVKEEIISEVVGVQRGLMRLIRIGDDTAHVRTVADRMESKLDAVRPYRGMVAATALLLVLTLGVISGWYVHVEYARYRNAQAMEAR